VTPSGETRRRAAQRTPARAAAAFRGRHRRAAHSGRPRKAMLTARRRTPKHLAPDPALKIARGRSSTARQVLQRAQARALRAVRSLLAPRRMPPCAGGVVDLFPIGPRLRPCVLEVPRTHARGRSARSDPYPARHAGRARYAYVSGAPAPARPAERPDQCSSTSVPTQLWSRRLRTACALRKTAPSAPLACASELGHATSGLRDTLRPCPRLSTCRRGRSHAPSTTASLSAAAPRSAPAEADPPRPLWRRRARRCWARSFSFCRTTEERQRLQEIFAH
jgi:hypothetical protein